MSNNKATQKDPGTVTLGEIAPAISDEALRKELTGPHSAEEPAAGKTDIPHVLDAPLSEAAARNAHDLTTAAAKAAADIGRSLLTGNHPQARTRMKILKTVVRSLDAALNEPEAEEAP